MRKPLIFFFIPLILFNCSSPKEKIPPEPTMKTKSGKVVVYQLMTRLFGNKKTTNKSYGTIEENGVGKL